jgi:cytochrome c-type biogenesis protein
VNSIFEWLSISLSEQLGLALIAACGWGVVSIAFSPCHLTSVPLAIAFLRRGGHGSTLGTSLLLALGVLGSLAVIGVVTVAAGRIAGDLWGLGPWVAVAVLLLAGLYFLDVINVPSGLTIHSDRIAPNGSGAVVLGLLLGVTLGPCTFAFFAPVFAAAFGSAEQSLVLSAGLVSAFAVGHTVAIAVAGMLGLKLSGWISRGNLATRYLRSLIGIALLASAIYVIAKIP